MPSITNINLKNNIQNIKQENKKYSKVGSNIQLILRNKRDNLYSFKSVISSGKLTTPSLINFPFTNEYITLGVDRTVTIDNSNNSFGYGYNNLRPSKMLSYFKTPQVTNTKIIIEGLDENYKEIIEEVGVTNPAGGELTTNIFYRINRAYISENETKYNNSHIYVFDNDNDNIWVINADERLSGPTRFALNIIPGKNISNFGILNVPSGKEYIQMNKHILVEEKTNNTDYKIQSQILTPENVLDKTYIPGVTVSNTAEGLFYIDTYYLVKSRVNLKEKYILPEKYNRRYRAKNIDNGGMTILENFIVKNKLYDFNNIDYFN